MKTTGLNEFAAAAPATAIATTAGSALLVAYANRNDINLISAGLFGAALGVGALIAYEESVGEGATALEFLTLSATLAGLVTFDRWYDGMWPFEREATT